MEHESIRRSRAVRTAWSRSDHCASRVAQPTLGRVGRNRFPRQIRNWCVADESVAASRPVNREDRPRSCEGTHRV